MVTNSKTLKTSRSAKCSERVGYCECLDQPCFHVMLECIEEITAKKTERFGGSKTNSHGASTVLS